MPAARHAAVLLSLALCAVAYAADRDPVLGTWILDGSRSTFDPGPPLKSQTRTYEQTAKGVKFTLTGVSSSGKRMRVEYVATYDGKDHPLEGSPSVDSVSLRRLDAYHVEATEKKRGEPMFHVTRVISQDGKHMTVTSVGKSANGIRIRNVLVFDRK